MPANDARRAVRRAAPLVPTISGKDGPDALVLD